MMSTQGTQFVPPAKAADSKKKKMSNRLVFDEEKEEMVMNDLRHNQQIREIKKLVLFPLRFPKLSQTIQLKPSRGILLCGPHLLLDKIQIGLAVANETSASFFLIKGSELMSQSAGECERNLREAFEHAKKKFPAIIFIDELDLLAPKRKQTREEAKNLIVIQLSKLMDGLNQRSRVVVMGTTDEPSSIDFALRSHSRFFHVVNIPSPLEVLRSYTKKIKPTNDDGLDSLMAHMEKFGVADVKSSPSAF